MNEEFSKERICLDRDKQVVESLKVALIVSGDSFLNIFVVLRAGSSRHPAITATILTHNGQKEEDLGSS